MNRKYFILLIIIIPIIIAAFAAIPFDTSVDYDEYLDPNFEITNYSVSAKADKNRHVYVTEIISVNFINPRSSIIRDIPVSNGLQIKDINSPNRTINVEKYGSFLAIDLDSENFAKYTGPQQYELSYTMILPKVKGAKDSIPLNVIGQGWGVPIHNAQISISLPETPIKSYYYVGKRGTTTGIQRLTINTDNKNITLSTTDTLQPFEGITIGYDMPEGTLNSAFDSSLIYKIILAILVLALASILFIKFGKDEQIYPIINFNANGLNPAETGYLIDGNCAPSDLTSLIYYWASKGYLNIIDSKNNNDIILKKLKPLDTNHKKYEFTMFNALFRKSDTVTIGSLKNSFYTTITQAQIEIRQEYSGKLFHAKSFFFAVIVTLLTVLAAAIPIAIDGVKIHQSFLNIAGFMFAIPAAIIFVAGSWLFRKEPKLGTRKKTYYILFGLLILLCCLIMIPLLTTNFFVPKAHAILYAITFAITMCIAPFIQKRTDYYHGILNDITGFRNFIKEAEKEKLEMLLKENPQYYYDILPYANVLGVSTEWMNKFQGLTIEPPYWYRSYRPFDFILFNAAFSRSMTTITSTVISRPAPSGQGGGGFGGSMGGGFGGGGFGGGGGRSR